MYNGLVLPIFAKFTGKDNDGKTFYIPETNSVVYTYFTKDKTDKVIIELAFNYLKYNKNEIVSSNFLNKKPPSVSYYDNDEHTPLIKKSITEINERIVNDFQQIIFSNEKIIAQCVEIDRKNEDLIKFQEDDYLRNCVSLIKYSNCSDLAQRIKENKIIAESSKNICTQDKGMLAEQYRNMKGLKDSIARLTSSSLEDKKHEFSEGIYFPDVQSIYMRVVPNQDSFNYLSILLHELFHHYSNNNSLGDEFRLPQFISEGFTDLQTYRSLNLSDHEIVEISSYSKEVQIILALLEKIPEKDLITVYFKDDRSKFKNLFNKYFPDVNYEKFLSKGDKIFKMTYGINETDIEDDDLMVNHPLVKDIRILLGLKEETSYEY